METGRCSFACAFLHLFINVLLLVLGMCLLGFGLAEESTRLTSILSAELKIGSLAVVIGVILIVMTTLNCCFTIDGSSVFYYIYAGFLVLLFIAMVGLLVAFGPDFGTKVKQDIRESMREMMYFDPDGSGKTGMDITQQMFQCCGVDSYKDWNSVAGYSFIPDSCCVKSGCDTSYLKNIYQEDCVSSMMKSVDALFAKITAIGIAITIFLPFQIILVIFLVRCVPSDPVYQ
ncbi:CD63 antigen-like [Daphnia pulex]|uniref:CD63 antigen-like n=1 Tax=Daphnia pulex TaxID=6669 RepID=UPI001EDD21C4|nr:CD63 antigen-like [Daphnia pulex]